MIADGHDALRAAVLNPAELVAKIRAFEEVARQADDLGNRCSETLRPAARFEG